ncbi:MAG: MmgE/PrpD family protein [Burkholderiales bacterium]
MNQNSHTDVITPTRTLCAYLAGAQYGDLTPAAIRETHRGVLDWIGCALAGSRHETINKLLGLLQELGGQPRATVLGRNLRLGLLEAPLANGQMGHILDYDDTHMGGVVLHASSPVLAALFALAERVPVSGADLMLAYAVGFEAGVRCGRAAPGHHKGGWHPTGTLGSIAAGLASGRLLKLDTRRLTYTMGLAATQAAGMQLNRGTSAKSFHAGKAASNGLLAALLAQNGFDSSQEIMEGKKGFCTIYSDTAKPEQLVAGLGQGWQIESNGYKPYACGILLHPLIDAVIALKSRSRAELSNVSEIVLRVHPEALTVSGIPAPATGLQAKFSAVHSAAVAFVDGAAGVAQYTDSRANEPGIVALRRKVKTVADDTLRKDEVYAALIAGDTRDDVHIEHASGTAANPMSDAAITAKFEANATPVIGEGRARQVCDLVWGLEKVKDVRDLMLLLA